MRPRLVTLALSMIAVGGCGNSTEVSDEEVLSLDGITTVIPSTLTACTSVPYEPFEYRDGEELKGIDIDLVRAIAEDLGVKPAFKELDFNDIFDQMTAGQCDMAASSVSITPEREEQYAFSDGYFEINQSMLIRQADTFQSLADVTEGKVAVLAGSTGADYARSAAPQASITEFDDAVEMIEALKKSEVNAVVQDFPINSFEAERNDAVKVAQTFTDVGREQYAFAFPKSSTALRDKVNEALRMTREDGTYDEILSTYLGGAASK